MCVSDEQRIKIAYIVHSMQVGGIERSIARLVNYLPPERYDPFIVCLDRKGPAVDWIERPAKIIELRKPSGNSMRTIARLRRVFKSLQPDIIQSHNWGTLVESALARRNIAHIHAERGTVLGEGPRHGTRFWIKSKVMRWALRGCQAVMSNAHSVARQVADCSGFPLEDIQVIPNGVVPPTLTGNRQAVRAAVRESLGIPQDAFLAGSVGRLNRVKGFELPITAVASLRDAAAPHLLLVGNGPEAGQLAELAASLPNANHIHFAGERQDVGNCLAAMDLYINSSYSEGMSQSVIEAMSFGLPLLVSDVGDNGILAGRDGQRGNVLSSRTPSDWTSEILTLASSPQKLAKQGTNSLDFFDKGHRLDAMIQSFMMLYESVLRQ